MADTPTRTLLKKTVSKRLQETGGSPSLLEDLSCEINSRFQSLEARLLYAKPGEAGNNSPAVPMVEVTRKTKAYIKSVGPHDGIKVVFEGSRGQSGRDQARRTPD